MKAFQIARYSKTDLSVQLTELERPQLAPHEVLIQVKAAGVNPLDNMVTRGEVRLIVPYQLPLTMGHECSGVIAEVGAEVTDFAPGDRVFTRLPNKRPGAFAEYVAVEASAVALMPQTLDFVEAASIPLTALTAYQALELLGAKAGQSIFISGGSGGLGALACRCGSNGSSRSWPEGWSVRPRHRALPTSSSSSRVTASSSATSPSSSSSRAYARPSIRSTPSPRQVRL